MLKNIPSMRRWPASLAVTASLPLAVACQGGVANAGTTEIEGTLVLKGNEPFVQAVVVVSDKEQWELLGLHRSEAENHQNQVVKVKGQVVHEATPSTARRPSLKVLDFTPRLTKPAPASPK
jgi:hypothetical protein